MASNVPLSDTESSTGSSGVGENNTTINNPPPPPPPRPRPHRRLPPLLPRAAGSFKCLDCFCSFPTKGALMKHQREKGVSHSPPISRNMNRTIPNLVPGTGPQPVMPPHPPPTPTIVLPQPPRANPITSRLAPLPSPFRHNNVAGNGFLVRYHPYLRQETMPMGPVSRVGVVDHGSSSSPPPEKRTINHISQLDPTRDFLSQLERQPYRQMGNGTNVADVGGYGVDPYVEWLPRKRGTNKVTSNTGVDVTLKL